MFLSQEYKGYTSHIHWDIVDFIIKFLSKVVDFFSFLLSLLVPLTISYSHIILLFFMISTDNYYSEHITENNTLDPALKQNEIME